MRDKIINFLKDTSYPIRARYIASALGVDRTSVNRVLYANINNPFIRNDNYEWSLKRESSQVKKEQHWAITALVREWRQFLEYVLEIYAKNPDLFDQSVVNYNFSDKSKQLTVELEVYLMHFLLDIQFYLQPGYIDDDAVHELLNQLKPSLYYDYSSHAFTINYLKSKFIVEDSFIMSLLLSLIRFDDAYETRKSYIVLEKIRSLAICISIANDQDSTISNKYYEVIKVLKDFISTEYDYSDGGTNSFERCENCDTWVLRDDAEEDSDGNYYCSDCDYLIDNDEESDDSDESEETSNYNNSADSSDYEKDEIIEDCTTCKFKKNGSCPRAHLNKVCDKYKYQT